MNFSEYYYSKPVILEAMSARSLLGNTDPKRKERAYYQVKHVKNVVIEAKKQNKVLDKMEYECRAEPSYEKRNHKGYIIYDPNSKGKDIYQLFCDCADFHLRLYAPFVKAGMAIFDLENKYQKRDVLRQKAMGMGKHNRKWTKKTNPDGDLYLCKHHAHIVHGYILGELRPNEIMDLKTAQDKIKEKKQKQVPTKEKPFEKEVEKKPMKKSPEKPMEKVSEKVSARKSPEKPRRVLDRFGKEESSKEKD